VVTIELSERSRHILKTLIESYIRDGHPVGSRTIAKDSGLDLSPATVRNVMMDLEEMGLVASPHTSAGRIPTAKGYRFFVDSLLKLKPLDLDTNEVKALKGMIVPNTSLQGLISSVSTLLSGITHMAGVVTMPRRDHLSFRHIEFMPLSQRRILAILVFSESDVENRIIHTDRDYSIDQLHEAANYINASFAGRNVNLYDIHRHLLEEMKRTKDSLHNLMQMVVEVAEKLLPDQPQNQDYVLEGQVNLMEFAELSDVDRLRLLFQAFSQKRDILYLLDQCVMSQGIQIFIGEESGYEVLDECSVVTSTYGVEDQVLGVLGVIGPTRMDYDRVISVVDVTAKLLSSALNNRH
jgi:heat-inducible transcriptional repressor